MGFWADDLQSMKSHELRRSHLLESHLPKTTTPSHYSMPTWPWESDGPADTLIPPPDVLARIPTLDRATNWSKSTLRLRVDNKFVLHHIMVVCFDLRVYDKAAGKKGDLMVQAATVLNEKILSKSVTKVRIGSKEEWRKPALLTQNNLKTIVDTELSRFSILNKTEERATGEGEPAEQTPESIAASQELQLYWSTCTHLLEMQVQTKCCRLDALTASSLRRIICLMEEELFDYILSDDDVPDLDSDLDACMIALYGHLQCRNRPPVVHLHPRVTEPWNVLNPTTFQENCRFAPLDFLFVVASLQIPTENGLIRTPKRSTCEYKLAMFIVFRRLALPDRWYDLEALLSINYSTLNEIYMTTLSLICDVYEKLITRVDIVRILPEIANWARAITEVTECEGEEDIIGFIDGKFGRTCRPIISEQFTTATTEATE